jgi:hypothetical protein
MSYKYILSCGSGSTKITLKLNRTDKTFEINYYSHWMGDDGKLNYLIEGIFTNDDLFTMKNLNFDMFNLKIQKITDLINNTSIDTFTSSNKTDNYLIVLDQPRYIIHGDKELEGMIMGGASFNNNDNKYDSIIGIDIIINEKIKINRTYKSFNNFTA